MTGSPLSLPPFQALSIVVEPAEVPGPDLLSPSHERLGHCASVTLSLATQQLLLELLLLRNWRLVRQGLAWRCAKATLAACVAAACAQALQQACDVRWDAPGAPAKQPALAQAADAVLWFTTMAAAPVVTAVPALVHALFGPWCPSSIADLTWEGLQLIRQAFRAADLRSRDREWAEMALGLFAARPAALRALHAAVEPPAWALLLQLAKLRAQWVLLELHNALLKVQPAFLHCTSL